MGGAVTIGLARGAPSRHRPPCRAGGVVGVVLAALVGGCGYHPVYSGVPESERLAVVGAASLVADAAVVAEVEAGMRAGLATGGALRPGRDHPRVLVEVLRVDVLSEGVAKVAPDLPLARGSRVAVVARAWLERAPDQPAERDTGDMGCSETMATEGDSRLEAVRLSDATRAAARRLGERMARKMMGQPEPAYEGL